jgi:hypothetical protein
MGYDVHITRRLNWFDTHGPSIRLEEWLALIASHSDMRLDGYAEAKLPGGMLRMEASGLAVWTAYSKHLSDGNMVWFYYAAHNGSITVKNPDTEILCEMYKIAIGLRAKVQGDELEWYDEHGTPRPQ